MGLDPVDSSEPKPVPEPASDGFDLDVEVVPQELLRPQPKTESAEMLVDLPPEELRGNRSGHNEPLPQSGVYAVKPVAEVRESSQPEVAAVELSKPAGDSPPPRADKADKADKDGKDGGGEDVGKAQTLPGIDLSAKERAAIQGNSAPDLVFEAAAPDETGESPASLAASLPQIHDASPQGQGSPVIPLSEMLAQKPKSSWYTNTWVIVAMAVVAAGIIAGIVIMLTRSG